MITSSLVINFTPDPRTARPDEKYWIRLEQVEQKPPTATVGQVAEIADKLFEIEPCDDQGNGGEAPPDEMPSEQDVVKATKEVLGVDPCGPDDTGKWTGQIKIYRSHQAETYRLVCTNGKVLSTVTHSERVDTVVAVTGKTSVELEKPVYSGFSCDFPGAELIGSTLWFSGPEFTGFVHVRYASGYDLAEIEVTGIDDQPQAGHVVAFYHHLVADTDIEPPGLDEATEQALDCSSAWDMAVDAYDPARCMQTTRHTVRCECFGQEIVDTYETEEEVGCPDYARCPAGFIDCDWYYPIKDVTEYVSCSEVTSGPDGSVKRVNKGDWPGYDADYYEDKCCNRPGIPLPPCETKVQVYRGGVEIKGGPEKYRRKYGDDVELIGVAPGNGICGKLITRQIVQQKNCCDGVSALEWDYSDSVSVLSPDSHGIIFVNGGIRPITISVRGPGFWLDADHTIREGIATGSSFLIFTDDSACGGASVTVSDGCSSAQEYIRSTAGYWDEYFLDEEVDCQDMHAYYPLAQNTYVFESGREREIRRLPKACSPIMCSAGNQYRLGAVPCKDVLDYPTEGCLDDVGNPCTVPVGGCYWAANVDDRNCCDPAVGGTPMTCINMIRKLKWVC